MLVNLLATSNQGSYNITLAHMFGLPCAIYINELINITEKALRKNKVSEGFITLDRAYIEARTTLSVEDQLDIDKRLIEVGILQKSDCGNLNLNILELSNIMMCDDETLNKDIEQIMKRVKKATKRTKEESIAEKLKSHIQTTNQELREAYSQWIDTVIQKEGWMSVSAVICGEQIVNNFANHNLDTALCLVRIASINGYRDIQWAINSFQQNYQLKYVCADTSYSNEQESEVAEVF